MTRMLKVFAIAAAGIVLSYLVLANSLRYYDSRTRERLLQTVGRELPVAASKEEMSQFLRRHTYRFAFDAHHNEYGGFVRQTKWDRFWFGRQVRIVLKVNPDGTLRDAEISVFYTAL